jgi:aldehyde decarbonylase
MPNGKNLPLWRTDGAILIALLHAGPVEFIYYWFHRALHHHILYTRYHSHHHASIVTEPITCKVIFVSKISDFSLRFQVWFHRYENTCYVHAAVIHPFAEMVAYTLLFTIPTTTCYLTGTASIMTFQVYLTYIDFMNNMGHCNFELVPTWLFQRAPPLKYLMYTPS